MVWCGLRSRDRVEASLMEGLTATDPLDPKPGTLHGAMYFNGLIGIAGTAGMEPALRTEKRGERPLVNANHPKHQDSDGIAPRCHDQVLFLDNFMRFASTASSSHDMSVVNSASSTSADETTT
jgi:hypothetical protein